MLVAKKVDVIWTSSPLGTVAAARATNTIPIVFWRSGFPVELGLVDSLARPGRNVTGLTFADPDTILKRYQLLREIAPSVRRLAILWPSNTLRGVSGDMINLDPLWARLDAFLRDLRFEVRKFEVLKDADVEPALAAIAQWRADSLSVPATPETISERKRIIDFARRNRLPTIYQTRDWVEAGGLFSYGIVEEPTLVRTAELVDRILRGAKPADLPVELPNLYELTVNLATAKALGIKVPQSILLRADKVIE
jgi:putative ABC transport system substrate-binding protein